MHHIHFGGHGDGCGLIIIIAAIILVAIIVRGNK